MERRKVVVDTYTDLKLKEYVTSALTDISESRDFVKAIEEYISSNETRVLMISGLRGTGKTVGVLQGIRNINDYENTVFINIDATAEMDCFDLRNLIESEFVEKKYIFIDEITRVNDLVSNSGFLADKLCKSGKKVILSGTDSLALTKSEGSGLYHRAINKNVTHINFMEAKRTAGQSFKDYMEMGGLYQADTLKDIDGLRQYIDTAVVDNILNTLNKNKKISSLLNLSNLASEISKLRTIVFRIIYAIIYASAKGMKEVNVSFIINLFHYADSKLYDIRSLNSLVCSQMGVDERIEASEKEVLTVLEAMLELGLLVKVGNICKEGSFQYYITNPSIINQVLYSMVSILDTTGLEKKTNSSIKGFKGKIFESIVVNHTKLAADKLGFQTYYYHDMKNREVDLIVRNKLQDEFEDWFVCYEIKLTTDIDTAVVKSCWINDNEVNSFMEELGEIREKGIIYRGVDSEFSKFMSKDVYPPKNMTIEEIELQNQGIKLFSVETYLSNINHVLGVLAE